MGDVMSKETDEKYPEKETTRRMKDVLLRRALNTPHKPHKELVGKGGKPPKPAAPKKGRSFRHQGR